MARHADMNKLSLAQGGAFRLAGQAGLLTTTVITNATSNQDLQDDEVAQVTNGVVHGEYRPMAWRTAMAIANGNNADFDVENADVTGATTVETLADLTANTDGTSPILDGYID